MSFSNLMTVTKRWLTTFLRQQAEISAQTELFLEAVPWRTEQ
jgi:hypothetical protein